MATAAANHVAEHHAEPGFAARWAAVEPLLPSLPLGLANGAHEHLSPVPNGARPWMLSLVGIVRTPVAEQTGGGPAHRSKDNEDGSCGRMSP
jgi:hypothetical protein